MGRPTLCRYATVRTLLQQYVFVPSKHKDVYLTYILNELAGNTAIVFVSTCANAQRLALTLRAVRATRERARADASAG